MRLEIVTIGSEILCGNITDTNFSYLAKRLAEEGYFVARHTSVPDEAEALTQCLQEALQRSDCILTTGGLGPTLDDHTKEVMCLFFQKTQSSNKKIRDELIERYGPQLPSLDHQSTVPEDTHILQNKMGTAPGFLFTQHKKSCFVMPGVSLEMQHMFEEEVLPLLQKMHNPLHKKSVSTLHFCHLPENAIDPYLREMHQRYPQIEYGIYPRYGTVSVELKIDKCHGKAGQDAFKECEQRLLSQFREYFFSREDKELSLAIHQYMIKNKKTLAVAESCTGGHIAAKLVDHPGASEYFLGGVVCYSNILKQTLLGVKPKTLEEYGAVSRETVEEMVAGCLKLSGADYVLAVSGIAGPTGGSADKPVGTVWCGLGEKGKPPQIGKILAKARAKRASMIEYTANFMLGVLWRKGMYDVTTL